MTSRQSSVVEGVSSENLQVGGDVTLGIHLASLCISISAVSKDCSVPTSALTTLTSWQMSMQDDKTQKKSKIQRNLEINIEAFMKDLYKEIKLGTNKKAETQNLLTMLKNDKEKAKALALYVCDRDEMSLLHLAAIYHDDKAVIKELLEICPELLTKKRSGEYEGQTALHIAILKKNCDGAEVILMSVKKRLNELETEENKKSPVHLKLQEQFKTQLKDLKKMIHAKATGVIFKNTKMMGELPLTIAALNFDEKMINLLLKYDAKIRKRNSQGDTVFHTLVRYAQMYPDDLEHVKKSMQTLYRLLKGKESRLNVVDQIKEHNMAVWFKRNKEGLTVLQLAALLEQPEIFKLILDLKNVYKIQEKTDGLFESTRYDITEIDSVTHMQWSSPTVTGIKVTPIIGVPKQSAKAQKVQDLISVSKEKDKMSSSTPAPDKHKPLTILSREPRSPSVLEIICETKKIDKAFQIINLPVVQNVIAHKWRKYLPLYFLSLTVHTILMAFVTAQTILKAQLILPDASINAAPSSIVTRQSFVNGTSFFLFVFGVILLILEAVRIWHREPMCLALHHHNGLYRVQLVVLALSMMGDSIWYWVKRYDNNYLLILALVVGWWYFSFFLRPFKMFSFFTVMIRKVLFGDLLRFSTIIIIDLLAFSFAMYATFLPSPGGLPDEFRHLGVTLMTMFKLLLGLIDLSVLYDAPQAWVAVTLFVAFTLMTYILMVNALIAMMSKTCSTVTTTRVKQWQLQRLSVILMIEGMLPPSWRLNSFGTPESSTGHVLRTRKALREGRYFLTLNEQRKNKTFNENEEQASPEDVTKKRPQRQTSRTSSSDDNTQARPPSGLERGGSNAFYEEHILREPMVPNLSHDTEPDVTSIYLP